MLTNAGHRVLVQRGAGEGSGYPDSEYKAAGAESFRCVDWSWALERAAARLRAIDPVRTFFYSSGRSSNEAGFVFQLLARAYGTNNVNNCSYYCHQATSVGLDASIGTGTATVELADLTGCDLIFLIGANPASNPTESNDPHPFAD